MVITAGAKQRKGESRIDLIGRNLSILRSVIASMKPFKESTVLLLVANPVDVLVYFAQRFSGLPASQVMGSGTLLDSIRLRGLLAEHAQVAPSSIDAYVLGEHGDSQFVAWSLATVGGVPIAQALPEARINRAEIAEKTRRKAQFIIEAKGATAYGIGSVVGAICGSILFDTLNVRPISHFVEELGCCLSLPVILGRRGVVGRVEMPLNEKEKEFLEQSAEELRGVIGRCESEGKGE